MGIILEITGENFGETPICWQNFMGYVSSIHELDTLSENASDKLINLELKKFKGKMLLEPAKFGDDYCEIYGVEFKTEKHKTAFILKWSSNGS